MSIAITLPPSLAAERGEGRDVALMEIREGLSRAQKELPSKYFYDERGSELFEEITRLPEYYLTSAEREILVARTPDLMRELRARTLVELGAGSARKTRVILDAMSSAGSLDTYVPVDVSREYLARTARHVCGEYPELHVVPLVADIAAPLHSEACARRPTLIAFLGSTIGNFNETSATELLRNIAAVLDPCDRLLLGVDLRKDTRTLERAYNDAAGVTARFNRNILCAMNTVVGADFQVEDYDHRAFYEASLHRIEMHLVARRSQRVHIAGMSDVEIRAGESIRTEISCKYDRPAVDRLLAAAGLAVEHWFTDSHERFALTVSRRSHAITA